MLNAWFSTNINYEGQGKAIFSNPPLVVEGYVKIQFDEFGNHAVIMNVEEVDTESSSDIPNIPLEFKKPLLMALLSGEKPVMQPVEGTKNVARWRWPITGKKINPCEKLKVVTLDGIFIADKNISYNIRTNFNKKNEFNVQFDIQLEFHLTSSVFYIDKPFEAKYWVLPLINFISDFKDYCPDLDSHPLRIYSSPINPDDLTKNNRAISEIQETQNNRLIIFRFLNQLGFIERLYDYDIHKKQLLDGQTQSIMTSLMVGERGSKPIINFDDLKDWFPFQFLDLLGLASGTEIGAPWIEFRDARCRLVQRFHISLNSPWFSSGHISIDENVHHGIGSLLTQSQYSLHWGNAYLTAALKHLVRSGMSRLLFEDRMAHLFQALDCLCEVYGLNVQRLANRLDHSQKIWVKQEITYLVKQIRSQSKVTADLDQRNVLEKIANRIQNADNTDRDFGLAVIDLIALFGLQDANIVDAHYQKFPRKDGKSWCDVLSHYRGVVIHSSYFDFERGAYDFQDIATIRAHLHDILIRIVLKMLYYNGTYEKAISSPMGRYPLDWVSSNTQADELGYKSNLLNFTGPEILSIELVSDNHEKQ